MTKHINKLNFSDNLWELACGFQKSRVFLTAYELKVFTVLQNKSKSALEVAKAVRINSGAVERLMNALCAIGLLKKEKDKFANSPLTLRLLVKGRPEFMAGLMHTVHLWDSWSTLTQAVRRGKSVITKNVSRRPKMWVEAFIAAMHERAQGKASKVILMLDLSGIHNVLDVGGGSGVYAMAFVQAKRGIKTTVFDLPNVIKLTRKYVQEKGLLDSIKIVSGDYTIDKLGNGFDLVFLSAIIHSNSFDENRKLIKKCVNALNPGGQVVVQDFIMDEDRISPAFGAFFSLNMLVATEDGDTYTESEVRSWMKGAGLSNIIKKDTALETALIIGRKT